MAVLICIAMWILYLVFVQGDIHKQKVARKKNEAWLEKQRRWRDQVMNYDLQVQLEKTISDPTQYSEVYNEVTEVLSNLPKSDYTGRLGYGGRADEALVVMMAKRGFLPVGNSITFNSVIIAGDRVRITALANWVCSELGRNGKNCMLVQNGNLGYRIEPV